MSRLTSMLTASILTASLRVAAPLALALALLAPAPAIAWDPLVTSHGDVDDGNEYLRGGKAADALKAYEEAREEIPERPELHYDLGLAHFWLKDWAQATKAFERALERVDGPLKFDVLYALGTAFAQWGLAAETDIDPETQELAAGRWEKAAHYLERALRLRPGDESALRNLELALLRVDPPCRTRDDEYEANDTPESATPLPFPEGQQELDIPLHLCPDDEDWFSVEIQAGDRVFASVELEGENPEAEIALALFEENGTVVLRPAPGSDGELPAATELSYQEGQAEGALRLQIRNVAAEETAYRLKARVLPACSRLEDPFEDNDEPRQAHAVQQDDLEKMQQLRVCPQDDDWFAVQVAEGFSLVAVGTFAPEKGTPSIAIADLNGNVLAERKLPADAAGKQQKPQAGDPAGDPAGRGGQGGQGGQGEPLMVTLLEPPPGVYLVRVSGTLDVEASYGLQLMTVPPCPDGDDGQEDDDTPDTAKPYDPQKPQLLRVCAGDEDWIRLSTPPGQEQQQIVSVSFDHERGDLDIELWEPGGDAPLATSSVSSAEAGAEAVALPKPEEADDDGEQAAGAEHLLRVFGVDGASNFYFVQMQAPQPQSGGDGEDDQQQDEEKKDDEQQQDQQQPKPDEQKQKQQPRDQMEEQMDQLDRNPRNLEAERARERNPLRHSRPTKPW